MGRAVSVWGGIPRVEARPSVDGRVRGMGARSPRKSAGGRPRERLQRPKRECAHATDVTGLIDIVYST